MQINFWLILWCIIGVIAGYLFLKAFIQEIVHYGLKGLFIFFPKIIYKLIKGVIEVIGKILGFLLFFLKSFFKALKICIRGA